MNHLLGTTFTGVITDENEKNYFVQKQGITFKLRKSEGEHQLGDAVEGFGFMDNKQAPAMTTNIPKSRIGHFAFGTVTGSRRDLGVFVDIGLPEKDVVVSLDDLPSMKELWPKKDDRLMVSLKVDEKDRIWGELADEAIFRSMARQGKEDMKNKDVTGTIFRLKLIGSYLLTDNFYLGFIHPSERFQEPRLGEVMKARVIGVRPDGVLNLSLKPRAHEAIQDDALMILTFLERSADGSIPYTDKTSPEVIQSVFGISKGQFKRALGNLYKQKKIKQEDGFTYLIK
jgi:predicted RNA-binding protein (virulence factor B family)